MQGEGGWEGGMGMANQLELYSVYAYGSTRVAMMSIEGGGERNAQYMNTPDFNLSSSLNPQKGRVQYFQ